VPVNFKYKVLDGQIVMKEDYELQSDYIITQVDDMETLKKVTDDADDQFTPEE